MGTLLRHCWLFLVSSSPLSTSTVSTLTYPVRTKYVAVKLASERSYSLFQQACEACECYTKVNRAADTLIRRHQHLKLGTDRRKIGKTYLYVHGNMVKTIFLLFYYFFYCMTLNQ